MHDKEVVVLHEGHGVDACLLFAVGCGYGPPVLPSLSSVTASKVEATRKKKNEP